MCGANILTHLPGYGISSDAYHPTAPEPSGAVVERMIYQALKKANIEPTDIDYINAHATGTPVGDKAECQTLNKVFGNRPYLSSTKSMTGHSIGSSSALEAVVSVLCLQTGIVPATINLSVRDPDCPGNHVTESLEAPVTHVLSNSFGFGGTNGVLIFSKDANSG